jgi:hypothetical protein
MEALRQKSWVHADRFAAVISFPLVFFHDNSRSNSAIDKFSRRWHMDTDFPRLCSDPLLPFA